MESHVRLLGVLNIVVGILGVLIALGCLLFFGGIAGLVGMTAASDPDAAAAIPILGGVGGILFIIVLLFSVPGIVVGWGLYTFQSWARIVGIVFCALSLPGVPIGTAIGVYGLWVLLNPETEQFFRRVRAA